MWLLVALIVAAAVAVAVTLARRNWGLGIAKSAALGVLQVALLALLLVLAWRPALVTQTLRPQENSVAVLLDTSGSMLYGTGDESRLQQAIGALTARALPQLEAQFDVNLYAFAGDLVDLPTKKLDQVPPPGPTTHIGDAVLGVLRGAQSGAVAAVVLVTDGNDNSNDFDAAKIAEIASFGVPVHTVGVGAESIPGDLELEDVQVAPTGLPGSTVSAQVSIRHDGAALAQLKVYDGDKILASEPIPLPSGSVTTRWIDSRGPVGVRDLGFAPTPSRRAEHDQQLAPPADKVRHQQRNILYIEGEPLGTVHPPRDRDSGAVRVANLLKTTANKLYRRGTRSAEELTNGFPEESSRCSATTR